MVRQFIKKAFSRGGTIRGYQKLVLTTGFPCQDISNSGRRAGITGSRSGLWKRVCSAIRVVRPEYIVVENVAALSSRGMDVVCGDLAREGYNAEWNCLSSSAHGAPHERKRVITVATDADRIRQQKSWGCLKPLHTKKDSYREAGGLVDAFQRGAMPYVCGGHDGAAKRVDRDAIMALGNSVDLNVSLSAIQTIKDIEDAQTSEGE